jgi:hypothetical protein
MFTSIESRVANEERTGFLRAVPFNKRDSGLKVERAVHLILPMVEILTLARARRDAVSVPTNRK